MKYYGKFCIVCGRRIPELSRRRTTCSEFCRRRYKCGYTPFKGFKHLPYEDLTSIQEEAHVVGVSYGKYMVTRYEKERCGSMPKVLNCPFYKSDEKLKLTCEGGVLKFPDADARSEYIISYCSNACGWRKCSIAHCLENYYFRKDD